MGFCKSSNRFMDSTFLTQVNRKLLLDSGVGRVHSKVTIKFIA